MSTTKKIRRPELKVILWRKGYKQIDAAKALGVHRVYLSAVLNGRYKSSRLEVQIPALPHFSTINNKE